MEWTVGKASLGGGLWEFKALVHFQLKFCTSYVCSGDAMSHSALCSSALLPYLLCLCGHLLCYKSQKKFCLIVTLVMVFCHSTKKLVRQYHLAWNFSLSEFGLKYIINVVYLFVAFYLFYFILLFWESIAFVAQNGLELMILLTWGFIEVPPPPSP